MENLSMFNSQKTPLKIDKPIRLIELFAGIGSQAKALKILGANFEHYRICEFDKYAIKSYNAIHGTDFVTSDITQITADDLGIVDTDKYCYIMTYSFPCQDLSLAGKRKGMAKGENTRSGLLWEVERLLNECTELPQILLMENVIQVHGKKNKEHFDEWIAFLESKGYSNYWKDLNAKNFGIPQNRNRTFMVSILGDYTYEFPEEFPLELRLKDMLEDSVDEKFYLSDIAIQGRMQSNFRQYNLERSLINDKEIHPTILARYEGSPTLLKEPKLQKVCQLDGAFEQSGRVYNAEGLSPTIMSNSHGKTNGGYTSPKVVVEGYDPFIAASRGRNPENPSDRTPGAPTKQRLEPNFSGCTNTLTTVQKDNYVVEPFINVVGNYSPSGHDASRIVAIDGLAPTVKENHGTVTAIAEPQSCLIQPKDRNYKAKNQPRETHVEIKNDGISYALRTNSETMVIEPIVCEQRNDEGLRFFKGGCVGTLRTIDACGDKRVIEPTINKIDIPQTVRVRKYEVNCVKLCELLREYKQLSGFNNQEIADHLNIPLTKVEHWFRQDKYFAIPDENIWFELKAFLGIETDEFDKSIMTFEEKEGVFEKSNRCYCSDGLAPTITSASADEKVIEPQIMREEPLEREGWHRHAKEVLSTQGLCRTLAAQSNNLVAKIKEPYSLRIRKLTPKECWRLMGFDDADFEKAAQVNSNTQLYKQAGNSIVVDVLCYIFAAML